MFFDFVKRNSGEIRKENEIYFASLVISIIVFYVILSLGQQDVVVYLKTIESDAVTKLLMIIPVLYAVSLFFVFFLVYFANRYQLQRRSHEFGIYLMMGMKSSRLFFIIMGETLWNGLVALLIGVPISLFLTELISLSTTKIIGMGIIEHKFRISWAGLALTIFGFFIVQLLAVAFLSLNMSRKEPLSLLKEQKERAQTNPSAAWGFISFLLGVILLGSAYLAAILYLKGFDLIIFAVIFLLGISGTFLFFKGLGSFIGRWIKVKSSTSTGLFTFTGRQFQENILHQWSSLSIASLLILFAMICFAYGICGISMNLNRGGAAGRSADFTFRGEEKELSSVLSSEKLKPYISNFYVMKLGHLKSPHIGRPKEASEHTFSWEDFEKEISKEKDSDIKENLLRYLSSLKSPYLISLKSYNTLLKSINKEPINLEAFEVCMYSNEEFSSSHDIIRGALKNNPKVSIDDKQYKLSETLYTNSIAADRAITISYGLIVPDEMYDALAQKSDSILLNMFLASDFVKEKGLMQAIHEMDIMLRPLGLNYESYLASMGRQLFYIVAGSYTTLYLGIMFLIIANTVLGLKFLMQQRSTRNRYFTAAMLGASTKSLCLSARVQIWWYFILAISAAFISSIFGIWSMLKAFLLPSVASLKGGSTAFMAAVTVVIFILLELSYIWMIQRKSDEEIKKINSIC